MKDLLDKLDARKNELAALSPLKREDAERLWKKFRLEWNFNSNHIEGNTLTYQETELVLLFDQAPGGHTVREIEEMKAHDVAIALVQAWATDANRDISQADIRSLNETLLVRPFWKEAITPDGQSVRRLIKVGEYKEHPNSVRLANGEMFHYAEPHEVESKMGDLIAWYREAAKEVHPAIVAAKLHYDFVRIHPFDDGNGRVSRLLMNYHLLRHDFPPVIIKSEGKKAYLAALNRADVGDFEAFATYIAEQLLWSLDLSIRAAKGESVEEEGDWEKQVELLKRELDGKIAQKENDKKNFEHAIEDWLNLNSSILLSENEKRMGPFKKFFRKVNFKIQTRLINSDQVISIKEPFDWGAIAKVMAQDSPSPTISFINDFSVPILMDPNIARITCFIKIQFTRENIELSTSDKKIKTTKVQYAALLDKVALQPFQDLAEFVFKRVQDAIRNE